MAITIQPIPTIRDQIDAVEDGIRIGSTESAATSIQDDWIRSQPLAHYISDAIPRTRW